MPPFVEDSISDVKGFSEIKIAIQSKLSYAWLQLKGLVVDESGLS